MRRTPFFLGVAWLGLAAVAAAQTGNPQGAKDPVQPAVNNKYVYGKFVRAEPGKSIIAVRVGVGDDSRVDEYTVKTSTKYWGPDGKPLADGLRNATLTEGKEVWLQLATPSQTRDVAELWLSTPPPMPPAREALPPPPGGKGQTPPPPNKGQIPPPPG